VFSTAFELIGADLPFFSCVEKNGGGKCLFGAKKNFFLNVLLLKFDGLHFYGIWSHFEAFRSG
jgi:hypothetical protein